MNLLNVIGKIILILIAAPLMGGLLDGLDRKISAKMQRRVGPPLLQPFYDVGKLLRKKATTVNQITRYYVTFSLLFSAFTVVIFLMGEDILLSVFSFTLATVFFVIAGYSAYSAYSFIGTQREMVQIMCYEPMILIVAFGFYSTVHSFAIKDVFHMGAPIITKLPLIFIGLCYVLTIKLRKSPFDLSMSHHAHQELVKGITTELTGVCMAMVQISHWLETVFALGLVFLFFVNSSPISWVISGVITFLIYFVEIVIDNSAARIKWKPALKLSWLVVLVCGAANMLILNLI
jgi:ech hydrogenase subunit B